MASQTRYCNTYDTGVAWATSPANLVDGNVATFASSTSTGDEQENYFTTGQLFTIPTDATVNGIEVKVQHYEGAIGDNIRVYLCIYGGIATTYYDLPNSSTSVLSTVGSPTNKWAALWPPDSINDSGTGGFGVYLGYIDSGKNVSVNAAYVEVTVYYTAAATSQLCRETLKFVDQMIKKTFLKKLREVPDFNEICTVVKLGPVYLVMLETLKFAHATAKSLARKMPKESSVFTDRLKKYPQKVSRETVGFYDVLANHKTGVIIQVISETLRLVDTISRRWFNRRIRDTLGFVHSTAKKSMSRTFRGTFVLTHAMPRKVISKRLVQTVVPVDFIRKHLRRAFHDQISISHATRKVVSLRKKESVVASDRIRKTMTRRTLVEALRFAHATSLITIGVLSRIVIETLGMVDTVKPVGRYVRTFSEHLKVSDFPSTLRRAVRKSITQTIRFVEATRKGTTMKKRETLVVSHAIWTRVAGWYTKALAESLKLTDSMRRSGTYVRSLIERPILVDAIRKSFFGRKHEHLVLVEAIRRKMVYVRVMVQALAVVDRLKKTMARRLSQPLTLRDSHMRRFFKRTVERTTLAMNLKKGVALRRSEHANFILSMTQKSQFRQRLVETFRISHAIIKNLAKRVREGFSVLARTPFPTGGVTLSESLSFAFRTATGGRWVRRFQESLKLSMARRTLFRKALSDTVRTQGTLVKQYSMKFGQTLRFTESIRKGSTVRLQEQIRTILVFSKEFGKRLFDVLSISHAIRKGHDVSFFESVRISHATRKSFGKRLRNNIVLEDRISRAIGKRFREMLLLVDKVSTSKTIAALAVKLAEGVRFACEIPKSLYRRFIEALGFDDTVTPAPPILVQVGWLGSFPRPSPAASLVVQLQRENFMPVADAHVTAYVYSSDNGLLLYTVTMTEQSTAGVYRGVFPIKRTDPVGTYPVTIIATKGVLSTMTMTYEGYINVYLGMSTGISFH